MECRVRVCREFSGFLENPFDSGAFGVESGKRHAQNLLSVESDRLLHNVQWSAEYGM